MSVGSRIKERRNMLGITQEELAQSVGVTKGAIANYENQVSSPKIEILFKLFSALKCDANYLYQDDIEISTKIAPTTLSDEAIEVAEAYEVADDAIKTSVRKLLDVEDSQSDFTNKTNGEAV